jgi:hypothetical protein
VKVYKTNSYIRNKRGDLFPPFSFVLMSEEDKNCYPNDVLELIKDASSVIYKVYSVDEVDKSVDEKVDEEVDLEALTKAELVQYAKEKFNVDLEVTSKKDDLIAEIQLL